MSSGEDVESPTGHLHVARGGDDLSDAVEDVPLPANKRQRRARADRAKSATPQAVLLFTEQAFWCLALITSEVVPLDRACELCHAILRTKGLEASAFLTVYAVETIWLFETPVPTSSCATPVQVLSRLEQESPHSDATKALKARIKKAMAFEVSSACRRMLQASLGSFVDVVPLLSDGKPVQASLLPLHSRGQFRAARPRGVRGRPAQPMPMETQEDVRHRLLNTRVTQFLRRFDCFREATAAVIDLWKTPSVQAASRWRCWLMIANARC